ncbi:MAG: 23S rRNA (adenine(2030)-N(6))-methyltransferase RlmJ [Verrucomicrobia bacterium]|nr:23S rRNA (adenine(2030)-N(6))-methyltransferase RlmJ [Verrucomicrobiota bacterium]
MNYRHHFHAGNFADVMKHALLTRLVRALQKKEKGFLYLDTHAGRGGYDLTLAATGDTLERKPEWPEGIGRIGGGPDAAVKTAAPAELADYLTLVRELNRARGVPEGGLRFYPGSPLVVAALARPQDRLALCEKQPAECAALREELQFTPGAQVREMDGYVAVRAMLPPPERRALVLIDPPFEVQDEFAQIAAALAEGLRRLPGGVFAVWYPLTERARVDAFFAALQALKPPPTLALELAVAGPFAPMKLKGCGLVVVNPPWQFDREARPMLEWLAQELAQAPGGGARLDWIVPE